MLSIARGGVFVAGGLAYALDCKNIHLVNVEFYTGVSTTLDMPVMLAPVPNAIDFSDKKVLITDDVADTGKTLKLVHDFCLDTVAEVLRPFAAALGPGADVNAVTPEYVQAFLTKGGPITSTWCCSTTSA